MTKLWKILMERGIWNFPFLRTKTTKQKRTVSSFYTMTCQIEYLQTNKAFLTTTGQTKTTTKILNNYQIKPRELQNTKKQKLNSWRRLTLSFQIGEQNSSQSGCMSGASNWLLTCHEAVSVVLWNPRQVPKMLTEK